MGTGMGEFVLTKKIWNTNVALQIKQNRIKYTYIIFKN